MKKYFIHDGHTQLGPFSAQELIERDNNSSASTNASGLPGHITAHEITGLNEVLENSKVISKDSLAEDGMKKKANPFKTGLIWALAVAAIILGAFVYYNLEHTVDDASFTSPNIAGTNKQEINLSKDGSGKNELTNPLLFLNTHGKMHKNLVGKKIIKGTISNLAIAQGYKDLQLGVVFLSANNTELQTQNYFVNEPVKANSIISFRAVFSAPEETAGFRLKVLSATPVQ